MTQRGGMGRDVGMGSGWGTRVYTWRIHVDEWQKPSQYCKAIQFSSVAQLCLTLCDPMDCSMLGLPVHHQLLEFTQTDFFQDGLVGSS